MRVKNTVTMAAGGRTTGFSNIGLCLFAAALIIFSCASGASAALDSWRLVVQNAGVSAMHMTTMHTDKVVIYDRTNFGNSSIAMPNGTCRDNPLEIVVKHDCTAHSVQYDSLTDSIRALSIYSDPFCSAGTFLPNGTLLQTGGDKEGNRTIRFINTGPTDDWSEVTPYLFVKRWYVTNQILPTGNVILVGGTGQRSYEFYPKSTKAQMNLKMLWFSSNERNTENNLYPFVHLLPDGNLFIYANVYSQVFNYKTGVIVKDMPIFGSDPRNYPYSGTSVLLPLSAPYNNSQVEIMICGGGPLGAFTKGNQRNYVTALSTCGRLKPYDTNATWAVESMPGPRVMGDGMILPTGEMLIINGVMNGVAGWNMNRNPVFFPWLYDFNTHNFSVQSPTTIARVYHSTANMQSDGTVLVAGANDQGTYVFTGVRFPTELRIEKYSPYYLNSQFDFVRPAFTNPTPLTPMTLNSTYTVTFTCPTAPTSVQVSLYPPTFTTHTNSMHQRMVILTVLTNITQPVSDYSVDVATPPNGNIAPPQWYMMTVLNNGVSPAIPSKAAWVQVVP